MFNLQPCVHFQKVKVAAAIDDKLDGARRSIAHCGGQRAGLLPHRRPRRLVQKRARGLFDHFLIAPLDRTFAFVQIQGVAVAVGQHLNFDMTRLGDKFFNENPVIAKTCRRFVF